MRRSRALRAAAAAPAGPAWALQALGLRPGASRAEVRKAFVRAAFALHPDTTATSGEAAPAGGGRAEQFRRARAAYEALLPDGARQRLRSADARSAAASPSPGPEALGRCPECGVRLRDGSSECDDCGSPLPAFPPGGPREAPKHNPIERLQRGRLGFVGWREPGPDAPSHSQHA
eukprot:TRINITY_DN60198_c0_g1_i1.p2 TRINITY_DN60198_c0_g1~~TRINITY_DN60198_c0_g1_i1.p2  ORF type:complete len:175 (+),score=14.45 TRINITY_DN60198_c0_g1_i1:53-577(+)